MQRMIRIAASCGLVAMFVALLPLAATAHERRDVADGEYQMVVGFLDEPAFVGLKNGLDLRVTAPDPEGTPEEGQAEARVGVEGLVQTLQAEVIYGDQTMELELAPRFGDPGAYRGVFFPMAEGDYTFRIWGEIEGVEIDESFTSGPETFSVVEPVEPLQFPVLDESATGDGVMAGTVSSGGASGDFGGMNLTGGIVALAVAAMIAGLVLMRRRSPAPVAA